MLIRKAIIHLLGSQDDFLISGEAKLGDSLANDYKRYNADLAVIYSQLLNESDYQKIAKLRSASNDFRILLIYGSKEINILTNLVKIKVNGFLSIDSSKEELYDAIRSVYNGNSFYRVNHSITKLSNQDGLIFGVNMNLTHREKEILKLMADGLTSKQISEKLMLSKRTIDYARTVLMEKADVNTLAGLIRFAIIFSDRLDA